MTASDQRRLLGDFVRAHREKLPPEGGAVRRRTPGLRREELAARAGITIVEEELSVEEDADRRMRQRLLAAPQGLAFQFFHFRRHFAHLFHIAIAVEHQIAARKKGLFGAH